jgi:3-hydroxybutyryl-CoA dehydratase
LPGMLMAAMFPAIIGSRFPGALYLTQTLKFRKQAAVGSEITAEVTVTARSGSRLTFETICKDTCGEVLVDGTALAIIKQRPTTAPARDSPSATCELWTTTLHDD